MAPARRPQEFVTRQNYDAAGHAVETTSYATPFSVADFKQATLDSATAKNTSDQDRSTLSVYDAAGRDVYMCSRSSPIRAARQPSASRG